MADLYQKTTRRTKKLDSASGETKSIHSGIGNEPAQEPKFIFNAAKGETVLGGNDGNSYIVLGRDRPGALTSGYGGFGGTQCSTIDIVAGRISSIVNEDDQALYADPNFTLDAARIYISQRTDVDVNFNLVDGEVGNAKAKSAIALKADGIRIIGREGIKLVTNTDANNSSGVSITQNSGIDLIANNNDADLQPMLLGYNTIDMMTELIEEIDKLQNRVQYFIDEQQKYNDAIAQHTHISPFFGKPTTIPFELAIKNGGLIMNKLMNVDIGYYFQKVNFGGITNKYLHAFGAKRITSNHNRVN